MTREDVIKEAGQSVDLGTCRGCGHDLVISDDQDGPATEIQLECSILDTNECVAGEWFLISELIN